MIEIQVPALAALSHVPPLSNPVIISDLHLDVHKPKTIMAFLRFMQNVARRYAELVILGDLFDQWAGDDASNADDLVAAELTLHASTGRRVLIMRGESDVLLGKSFSDKCGAELIEDPIVIEVAGRPILFSHGDTWCTGNTAKMLFKRRMSDPLWQENLLKHKLDERRIMIEELRQACLEDAQKMGFSENEEERISNVAIAEAARQHAVDIVIHGHIHHPGVNLRGKIERWSCPNWDLDNAREGSSRSGYICFKAGGRPQVQML